MKRECTHLYCDLCEEELVLPKGHLAPESWLRLNFLDAYPLKGETHFCPKHSEMIRRLLAENSSRCFDCGRADKPIKVFKHQRALCDRCSEQYPFLPKENNNE